MKCVDRYAKYLDEDLDVIILNIRKGNIKASKKDRCKDARPFLS